MLNPDGPEYINILFFCRVFGCEENDSLVLNDFLTGVGQLKFRGTSLLLRSDQSAFAALKVNTKQ